jgi:hypothetical protein
VFARDGERKSLKQILVKKSSSKTRASSGRISVILKAVMMFMLISVEDAAILTQEARLQ